MTKDAHAAPSAPQELLYDPDVPTPSHGERALTMAQAIGTATLCTVAKEPAGYPYGSFVTFALDEGQPIFLISELAEHTKNLRVDTRASLLIAEGGADDPLANGRVTLIGDCTRLEDGDAAQSARETFLAAHPKASYYVDFGDFSFWKLTVSSIRYIGGYGRMSWVETSDWNGATPDPITAHADAIVSHMNDDHAEALKLYCLAFSKASDTSAATMTGIDRYGFEMSAETGNGPRPIRIGFDAPISNPKEAREALVAMVKRAREALA